MKSLKYNAINCLYRIRDIQKGRRLIRSLGELDEYFKLVAEISSRSEDAGHEALSKIRFSHEMPSGLDPFSKRYQEFQLDLYKKISGRDSYDSYKNEVSAIDVENARLLPYPYATRSAGAVGDQLVAQGHIIRHLPLPPPARLVEFGPGWGNLTLQLALTGYEVTAVEIDSSFAELIKQRGLLNHASIDVIHSGMLDVELSAGSFDLAIFYECFHHCLEPLRMLKKVHSLLKPGGFVIFGSEPISLFPYPWGLRLDGLSLWSIRKYGWLELGFSRGFWEQILKQAGFRCKLYKIPGVHIASAYVCQKITN